jgi:dTDP-4-dehydrorhamnose reductase
LLHLLRDHFGVKIDVEGNDAVVVDRSLDSSRFRREFEYQPPAWADMVKEL